jgi:hypothetical protein
VTPHRPGGDFEKAANAIEAWRQQQIAALTSQQRVLYDKACEASEDRKKAKAKELEERKASEIEEAARQRRLAKPAPELKPHIRGPALIARLAKKFVDDQVQGPKVERTIPIEALIEKDVRRDAAADVEQKHAREREGFEAREREVLDDALRGFEQAREIAGTARDAAGKASARDRAKTDFVKTGDSPAPLKTDAIARAIEKVRQKEKAQNEFQRAAEKTDASEPPMKSDPIARAIAKVKAKEEEERARNELERDTGRSLTDTFNRSR